MYRWLIVLLRILFPLDPVAQLREVTRYFISGIIDMLANPAWIEEFAIYPDARAMLEGMIASAEEGIKLLIHERACQILGLPYHYTRRPQEHPPRRARAMSDITARLTRVLALQDRLEPLAQRRAMRMRRELEQNPLRLAPSAQSTSPSLRLVEARRRCVASLPPQEWGRWHARACAHDGGGPVQPRAPPSPKRRKFKPYCLESPASEVALACGKVMRVDCRTLLYNIATCDCLPAET